MSRLLEDENMSQPDAQPVPNYVTCPCQHCSGKIEFDANQLDAVENITVPCPHCGLETKIFLPEQKVPPVISDDDFHLHPVREVEREEEIRKIRMLAEQGNADAQFNLGTTYAQGEGVPKDGAEAVKWWRKAAEQGHPEAQDKLGLAYWTGDGVPMDHVEATKWFRKFNERKQQLSKSPVISDENVDLNLPSEKFFDLVKSADAKWQYDLGLVSVREKDYSHAVKCFTNAAKQGHPEAQCKLGVCYMDGLGVAKDEAEAVKWFSKAAQQGNAYAEYSLGVVYFCGRGVAKDISTALKWWRRAAENGSAHAQHNLGVSYERGEGVIAQNYVEAYMWMKLAAAQGYEGASKNCEEIVLKMNAEQIAKVEPYHQMLWKRERLTLKRLYDFIGQNRIKARLELAIAAAKSRGESLDHILLIGAPGSGKATLANVIAKVMGVNLKTTSGPTITKAGDLAGLLTNLEEGDVLFIDEIHRLQRTIEEYLYQAMKDFQLDIVIDQGPEARRSPESSAFHTHRFHNNQRATDAKFIVVFSYY